MKNHGWKITILGTLITLLTISCSKSEKDLAAQEELVLAGSTFYPGEAAQAGEAFNASNDGGFIPGPSNGGGTDTGTIPPPGGSTGSTDSGSGSTSGSTDSGSGSTAGGSTSGSTDSGSTSGGTTSGSTDGGSQGSTGSGGTASNGSDSGTIPGGSTSGGNDSGTIPGGNTGGSDTGSNMPGGNTGGTDVGSNMPGGNTGGTDTGSNMPGGNTGGTDTGSTDSGSSNPGGNTGGTDVAGNMPPNDGGTIPGGNTGGGNDGGTVPPGGNNPPGDTGGNTPPMVTPPPTTGGNNPPMTTPPPTTGGNNPPMTTPPPTTGGNNPPPTGTTPPTTPPTGDEHPCSCKCPLDHKHEHCKPKKYVDVVFNRVCSARRSLDPNFVFFEDAKHPVLAIEAMLPDHKEHHCGSRKQLASMGMNLPPREKHVVMQSVKLGCVDLHDGKYNTRLEVNPKSLSETFGQKLNNVKVVFSVCDDTNQDGRCSDESSRNKVVVEDVVVPANRIPKTVPVEVWAGRSLTLANNPDFCEKQYSPLVIDISGDGIGLTGPINDPVTYDLNDTGTPLRTGWTDGKDDAFVVLDRNGNGKIDTGAELFGSATRMRDGSRARNGFEALREFDSNNDGKITNRDADWRSLRLWVDRNHDGVSDKKELFTLEKLSIEMISLDYKEVNELDAYGNATRQRAIVHRRVKNKLKAHLIIDVWFNTLPIFINVAGRHIKGADKVEICHIPPGNPENAHEIIIGAAALEAHLTNHGDLLGKCPRMCMASQ